VIFSRRRQARYNRRNGAAHSPAGERKDLPHYEHYENRYVVLVGMPAGLSHRDRPISKCIAIVQLEYHR
jgi:hypothetical protein